MTLRNKLTISIGAVVFSIGVTLMFLLFAAAPPPLAAYTDFTELSIDRPGAQEDTVAAAFPNFAGSFEQNPAPLFLVRIVGDEVRLISFAAPGQYRVLEEIDVRTLREADRIALMDGLYLYSEQELAGFQEDFGS